MGLTVLVLLGAGCGRSSTGSTGSTGSSSASATSGKVVPAAPPPAPVVWSTCASDATIQCGTVPVPIDYRHPADGMLVVAITRAAALGTDPIGTLLFNPGGPGESGNQILPVLLGLFPAAIRQSFNIVSFDPRGTGSSNPLRCGTPPSALTSVGSVPTGPGRPLPGTTAFTTMARACETRAAALVPFIDSTDTARDMDRIREALGLDRISYYGLSYGTVLGAAYADLFPGRVATMVLDGAVDVNATLVRQAVQEAPAAERSLEHLFAQCSARSDCPLGSDPRATFTTVSASLTRRPLPAPGHGDPFPVTVGDLDTATLFALSVPSSTTPYEAAVVAAGQGNGAPLRALALEFATDIDGSPLVDPLWAITCNDAADHPGPVAAGTLARSLDRRYPLLGAYSATYSLGGCVSWPAARQPIADLHPAETRPVLVIGNTGDPNTPIIGGAHLAGIFPDGRLLTWRGWGHTWLLSGPDDPCMQRSVTTYLTGGTLPHPGAVCS
jgi:pimeloyl-ACP methyl ester carboxylesterase